MADADANADPADQLLTSEVDEHDGDRFVEPDDDKPSAAANVGGWVATVLIALALTVVIKTFVFQAYSIPSESMVPTLEVGDYVLVSKLGGDPGRGDIVVFARPANDPKTSPDDPDVLIKRVIGLPGETIDSADGAVVVDGRRLDESYLPEGTTTEFDESITVPAEQILVLGDNRSQSLDGRSFGPIPQEDVVGRGFLRFWPFSRMGGL